MNGASSDFVSSLHTALRQDLSRVLKLDAEIESLVARLGVPMPLFHLLRSVCARAIRQRGRFERRATPQEKEQLKRLFRVLIGQAMPRNVALQMPAVGVVSGKVEVNIAVQEQAEVRVLTQTCFFVCVCHNYLCGDWMRGHWVRECLCMCDIRVRSISFHICGV